jgi:hypothetical protein
MGILKRSLLMTATHSLNSTASASPVLYVAFELSLRQ